MNKNVQRRRKERIKRLARERMGREEIPSRRPEDRRMQDPEYVWKYGGGNPWISPGGDGKDFAGRRNPKGPRGPLRLNVIICVFLFAAAWGLFHSDHPLAVRGQEWLTDVLNRDMDYARISAWYERHFEGTPSFLPSFRPRDEVRKTQGRASGSYYRPLAGDVIATFEETGTGLRLRGNEDDAVRAMTEGRVLYVGYLEQNGYTVIVQHAGNLQSIYAGLDGVRLKRNDWVEGGERLGGIPGDGRGNGKEIFFAVKKDNRYINPLDVISLD